MYREKFGEARVWAIAPGAGAKFWDEFQKKGIITIGWDEIGDLEEFHSRESIHEQLREIYGSTNPSNDSLCCHQFSREMRQGDHVIVKQGRRLLRGYGIIESDYEYDENRSEFRHTSGQLEENRSLAAPQGACHYHQDSHRLQSLQTMASVRLPAHGEG